MKYDDPELRDRLAAEYVLGTMPDRVRRRFERLIASDATLAARVAAWEARFAPLDEATPGTAPPARVWRAIERRVAAIAPPQARPRRLSALAMWRGIAAAAALASAALLFYVFTTPTPPVPVVIAVLADKTGAAGWIALSGPARNQASIAAVSNIAGDPKHSFELWAIAGGPPRPLGLLHPNRGAVLLVSAAALPATGGILAVSEEPPAGSPTGLPTGPVLYQGKVLAPPR
jgi:anti-sigma-K factor RskA